MKTIPLHALVLLVGTSKLKEQEVLEYFDDTEVISKIRVTKNIFGDPNRHIHQDIVNSEMFRLINLKLSLGERVVVADLNLSKSKRINLCNIGKKYGVPIYYIVHYDQNSYSEKSKYETFLENEDVILSGDNIANVIDMRIESFDTVKKFSNNILNDIIKREFSGITIAGDIHGNSESLKNAIEWSTSRNHLFVQLGDLVDYGPNSLECIDIMYQRMIRGKAIFVIGNHDKKLEKWFNQYNNIKRNKDYLKYRSVISLSDANKKTVDEIINLSDNDRRILETRFNLLMNLGRHHYNIDNFSFAHAGFTDEMFHMDTDRLYGKIETISLYGNLNEESNWITNLDTDKTIIVGHTIMNKILPEKINTKSGGTIIFQDTGCGKGGQLTTTDLVFKNNKLEIQNSNRW